MKEKIIFLDVDGVLNRFIHPRIIFEDGDPTCPIQDPKSFKILDCACLGVLSKLIRETGAKIVVSSAWRICRMGELEKQLRGIIPEDCIIGKTINIGNREEEIQDWIKEHKEAIESFVIIDDEIGEFKILINRVVKIDNREGLTEEKAEKVKELFRVGNEEDIRRLFWGIISGK